MEMFSCTGLLGAGELRSIEAEAEHGQTVFASNVPSTDAERGAQGVLRWQGAACEGSDFDALAKEMAIETVSEAAVVDGLKAIG